MWVGASVTGLVERKERVRRWKWWPLVAALLFTEFVYAFLLSAGKMTLPWPSIMDFYDQLAEGFRGGHLYIPLEPHPRLLAAPNPYDSRVGDYWLVDATLYRGRYYLYWGPVPALIQAVAKAALGIRRIIGDQYLVFFFASVGSLSGAYLIRRVAQRFASGVSPRLIAACALAFGLANPAPYMVANPGVYQAAILGAQAFWVTGLCLAFEAVNLSEWSSRRNYLLLASGVAWALAVGCRISLSLAVGPLALLTVWWTCLTETARLRRFIADALWLGTPIALGVALLLIYNKLRFDGWFEFGMKYAVSWWPYRYSTSYLLPNLESYFLRAPLFRWQFPYLIPTLKHGAAPITDWLGHPPGYLVLEPTIGVLYAVPYAALAPAAIAATRRKFGAGFFRHQGLPGASDSHRRRAQVWFVLATLFGMTPFLMSGGIYFATMRYLGDFTDSLLLLAIFGLFVVYGRTDGLRWVLAARRRIVQVLLAVGVVSSLIIGCDDRHFRETNPKLREKVFGALSFSDEAP